MNKQPTLPKTCNTHWMSTPAGLQNCLVPEFDPQKYQGLKKNCGKKQRKDKKK